MSPEFKLIQQYFTQSTSHTDLSIGDDAALIQVSAGHQLAISTDMSVAGTHFFEDAAPYDIGWKSLAVNVSDMAAMGANPKWATLSIALPDYNEAWLTEFARGLFACAAQFNIDIIGGDTTRGPLNIAIQIMGETPTHKALTRHGAKEGDDIWVSGQLGNAALGLAHLQQTRHIADQITLDTCLKALHHPEPRVALGLALIGVANSCIDVSDGLISDLGHILKASEVGATLFVDQLPCLDQVQAAMLESPQLQQAVMAGGDDYELCFTAPTSNKQAIEAMSQALALPITRIGEITSSKALNTTYHQQPFTFNGTGYDHFSE